MENPFKPNIYVLICVCSKARQLSKIVKLSSFENRSKIYAILHLQVKSNDLVYVKLLMCSNFLPVFERYNEIENFHPFATKLSQGCIYVGTDTHIQLKQILGLSTRNIIIIHINSHIGFLDFVIKNVFAYTTIRQLNKLYKKLCLIQRNKLNDVFHFQRYVEKYNAPRLQ